MRIMGKHLDWLRVELERHAKDRLTEEQTKELLAEMETHLEASIRARIDLGVSEGQAEQEAVEAFGEPRRIVREVSHARRRTKSGFIFEHGSTKDGGPIFILGFGVLRQPFASEER